jgi:hypothetical protein
MTQFNGSLKVDDEVLHLSFNRIYTADGEKFYIVVQKDGKFLPIDMKKNEAGKWKIVGRAPTWAKAVEDQLSEMIDRNI